MEIVAGVILGLFAVGFGFAGAAMLYLRIKGEQFASGLVMAAFAFLLIAALALPKAYRLVVGSQRQPDRALFSPLSLRIAGTLSLLAPLALAPFHPIGLLHLLPGIAASAACFALARQRSRHRSSRDPGFEGDPIEPR
jgi:hypothetical protein